MLTRTGLGASIGLNGIQQKESGVLGCTDVSGILIPAQRLGGEGTQWKRDHDVIEI